MPATPKWNGEFVLFYQPEGLNCIGQKAQMSICDDQGFENEIRAMMMTIVGSGREERVKERGSRVLALTGDDKVNEGLSLREHHVRAETVSHGAVCQQGNANGGLRG